MAVPVSDDVPTEPIGRGLTYDDLLAIPEDDGLRHELIDGEHFVSPAPRVSHQQVVVRLTVALHAWCRPRGAEVLIAPTDVVFTPTTVLEPDLLVLLDSSRIGAQDRNIPVPPDLLIEVSSPSTRSRDRLLKRRVYEEHGVPEFWFVDLDERHVEVYVADDTGRYGAPAVVADGAVASAALAGCTVAVADIFG